MGASKTAVVAAAVLALVLAGPVSAVQRYHIEGVRRRHHRHTPEADVQMLAQEDEAVTSAAPSAAASPAAAPAAAAAWAAPAVAPPAVAPPAAAPHAAAPSAVTMSCQDIDGKTVCMPTGTAAVVQAPAMAAAAPAAPAASASDPVVASLTQKLKEQTMAAETSTELAKGMVNEVRKESREMVDRAQAEARAAHAESDQLRVHILDLEDKLATAEAQVKAVMEGVAGGAAAAEPPRSRAPAAQGAEGAAPVKPAAASASGPPQAQALAQPLATAPAAAAPPDAVQKAMDEYNKLKSQYEAML